MASRIQHSKFLIFKRTRWKYNRNLDGFEGILRDGEGSSSINETKAHQDLSIFVGQALHFLVKTSVYDTDGACS